MQRSAPTTNPLPPEDVSVVELAAVAASPDPVQRAAAAYHPRLPERLRDVLATDRDPDVRYAAANARKYATEDLRVAYGMVLRLGL